MTADTDTPCMQRLLSGHLFTFHYIAMALMRDEDTQLGETQVSSVL